MSLVYRNPRDLTAAEWRTRYDERDEERRAQQLTAPHGRWIYRSFATRGYDLAPRDLDSILPITREEISHGGISDVFLYNECDVQDLARRLRPTFGAEELVDSDGGPELSEEDAWEQYRLYACQLRRIKPCRRIPNTEPNDDLRPFLFFYNLSDVEALHDKIEAAAASPTGIPIPR